MGATRNTGYLENLIQYDASDNVAIATSVNPSYKVTLGGSLLGTSAVFSGSVTAANTALGASGGYIITYGSNGDSRSWRLATDINAYGDFSIQQSTTRTGTTYANRLNFNATGAATFSSTLRVQDAIWGADGTSTSASIRFYNSNTGLYYPGSDALGIITNATEKMRITSAGDMYLTGRSTNGDYGMYFYSNDTDSRIYSSNSGAVSKSLIFYTSGNPRMTIMSGGNVLIGTTTSDAGRLQIQATGDGSVYGHSMLLYDSSASKNALFISHRNGESRIMTTYGGTGVNCDMTFWTTQSNGNQGERMRIGSDGTITGVTTIRSKVGFNLYRGDVSRGGLYDYATISGSGTDYSTTIFSETGQAIYFAANGSATKMMTITSGGNVLINTTSDNGRRLNVNGSGWFGGVLSTQKVEMLPVQQVSINSGSTFTLLSSDKINIRTNILVSVSIYWDSNVNAQRQYLLFLGATNTNWGTPNSAITVVASNDWSSGYVGAATFSIGGSVDSRTLNISVSGAATYNVTAYARVLEM